MTWQTRCILIRFRTRGMNQQSRIGALLIRAGMAFVRKTGLQLHNAQLHIVNLQFTSGQIVKIRQDLRHFLRTLTAGRADGEFATASADGGVVRLLNLPQIFVQRAAQMRQSLIVGFRGNELGFV